MSKTAGGLPKDKNGKFCQMLGAKLKALEKRMDEDPILRACLERDDILKRITHWKDQRNPLMHSMAGDAKSWNALEQQAALIAKEGKDVAWLLANAVSRLRKHKKRHIKDKLPVHTTKLNKQ